MQIDGAAELTHVPNNWSTFWKRRRPSHIVLSSSGEAQEKKLNRKQNENFEINTKRAFRDLWHAFMATQIFVKCQPKYLFNQR